jgi:hypothetical protein
MRRLRTLLIGTAATALLVAAVPGAPVAAGSTDKGTVAIVNGRPGTRVDVCINGKEIRSKLPYAKVVVRKLAHGKKMLKVFRKDPRRCKGVLLAKRAFTLPDDGDKTIVVTKRKPRKVIVFDNAGLGVIPTADIIYLAFRHAADMGAVNFWWWVEEYEPNKWHISADDTWEKGDSWARDETLPRDAPYVGVARVNRAGSDVVLAGPRTTIIDSVERVEWILVGTKPANARLVLVQRCTGYSGCP